MQINITDDKQLKRIEKERLDIENMNKKYSNLITVFEDYVRKKPSRPKTGSDFVSFSQFFQADFNQKKNYIMKYGAYSQTYGKKDIWAGNFVVVFFYCFNKQ